MTLPEPVTHHEFVQLLQAKSKDAFSILYDNYSGALYGAILKMVKRKEIADDLLQDAFIKIWRNIHLYDPAKGALFTFFIRITHRICIDYLRSKQYQKIQLEANIESASGIANSSAPSLPAMTLDLSSLTAQLPKNQQEIITLVFLRGYTHHQAAGFLGLPLGTVKTRCRAGIAGLRGLYKAGDALA